MTEEVARLIYRGQAWPIYLPPDAPEAARLAAEELQGYLRRISDRIMPIVDSLPDATTPCVELLYEEGAGDGFVRETRPDRVRLIGRSPRGLLDAVYDLLEDLGCRWYAPGLQGERVPRQMNVALPVGVKDEEPFLHGRILILGHEQYLKNVLEWIEWASRNRYSRLFFHPFPPRAWGGRYEKAWSQVSAEAIRELRRRGMTVEYGGHLLAGLLPRWRFWRRREMFRFDGKRRTLDYNLCPSSAEALALIRERARRLFKRYPVDIFHIWPDDIEGGGWCSCPECEGQSASDQALRVINEIADVLREEAPQARLSYLAYHDTAAAPVTIKPRPNVVLLYAPRERCYAHALDDPGCALNRKYLRLLEQQVAWFKDSGWPEHEIFEYYMDGILFKSVAPPLANLLPADLRAYHAHGCQQVGAIITADRPWLSPPVNAFLLGRLAWNPRLDTGELLQDYASGYYGGPAEVMAAYQHHLERAFHAALDLSPEEVEHTASGKGVFGSLSADALDFQEAPLEIRRAKLAALLEARKSLDEAAASLETATHPGAGNKPRGQITRAEVLNPELAYFQLARLQLDWMYFRQLAYCLLAERAARREIGKAVRQAEKTLGSILSWAHKQFGHEPRWLRQFQLTHAAGRAQLWKVRHDALALTFVGRAYYRARAALTLALARWRARIS